MSEAPWDGELTYLHLVKIEDGLKLPTGAKALGAYQRFYSAKVTGDGVVVRGFFHEVPAGSPGGVRIVREGEMPVVFDGGCAFVNLLYDLRRKEVKEIFCNASW